MDFVRGVCGAHGEYETAEVRDVWRTGGGRGLRRWAGKIVNGVFPERPQSFRYQRRPVDDCSPGLGGTTQDGGTRCGTFHSDMNRCGESQGWTMTCSSMPNHDRKGQGEDSPEQSGFVPVRSPELISHKWRELVSSERLVCRCHVVFL